MPTTRMPDHLHLPRNDEAHVWTAFLSESLSRLSSLEMILNTEEKQRAGRFLRAEDRIRYAAAHGILRSILGQYLLVNPADIKFCNNAFGKPALIREAGEPELFFNMAHSGDVVLYAIATAHRVGIDVELIRPDMDVMAFAQEQFSTQELRTLEAMVPSERTDAFFRCWTRKEAWVKARGEGLSVPLDQFSVAFGRDVPPRVVWASDDPAASAHWSMFDLVPSPGYAGAIVVDKPSAHLVSRLWVAQD